VPSQRDLFVFNTLDGFLTDAVGHNQRNHGVIRLHMFGFPDMPFGLPFKSLF
jgi:hypothetical protein